MEIIKIRGMHEFLYACIPSFVWSTMIKLERQLLPKPYKFFLLFLFCLFSCTNLTQSILEKNLPTILVNYSLP